MENLIINSNFSSYKAYINNGINDFSETLEQCGISNKDKVFIITDDIVYNIYKMKLEHMLIKYNYEIFVIDHGEENKNNKTVSDIYEFLMKNYCDRNSILIGFGGGIVGDLTGYVAATYMRGVRYINIPTTLMSMVDSSIGGKVAYNFNGIKNLIGTFYEPIFVYIAVEFLETLPKVEFINGLAEVIKHGLIKDEEFLRYITENIKEIIDLENYKLYHIIKQCLRIKSEVVSKDFKDNGYRNVLNFGHTIGHAIEVISNHEISHGYAVALGILVELKISQYMFKLDSEVYNKIEKLFSNIGFPTKYKVDNMDLFMYAINHDKKAENNNINFSLLENIGKSITKIVVDEDTIRNAIRESIERR